MAKRTSGDMRELRRRALRPLFAKLEQERFTRVWLGHQLRVGRKAISSYETGENRVPDWFITQTAHLLGCDPSIVSIPDPRDLYIQRPRTKR